MPSVQMNLQTLFCDSRFVFLLESRWKLWSDLISLHKITLFENVMSAQVTNTSREIYSIYDDRKTFTGH